MAFSLESIVSKAFTREDDLPPDEPVLRPAASGLPPGARNYLTAAGAKRFRDELERLRLVERPVALKRGGDPDARRQLSTVDQRIQQVEGILSGATVVEPSAPVDGRIRFGATVTVRTQSGETSRYRIVGVDETDIDRGWVSWLSPIAKALLNARVGDTVRFQFPSGEERLEIIEVLYEP